MGEFCFLTRDASAKSNTDRNKPIPEQKLGRLWYRILQELEQRIYARGAMLSDDQALKFVHSYDEGYIDSLKVKTNSPLHSLRVSLLTCYALEGSVPAPVLSKLLAGHSRILMTLYYIKISPSTMKEMTATAEKNIVEKDRDSFRRFLKDMKIKYVMTTTAFLDSTSIKAALVNRNPIGWEHRPIGLCLVGGNRAQSIEGSKVGGC